MSAIIYYMVHGGRQASANILLPHWERFGIPIVVITPLDDPIAKTKNTHIGWGAKGSDGEAMYLRMIHTLDLFVQSGADNALLVEFDCMCLHFIKTKEQFDFVNSR